MIQFLKLACIFVNSQVSLLEAKELFKVDCILKISICIFMLVQSSSNLIRVSEIYIYIYIVLIWMQEDLKTIMFDQESSNLLCRSYFQEYVGEIRSLM